MAATKLVRTVIAGVCMLSASVAIDVGSAAAQLEVPRVGAPQVELPSVPNAPVSPPGIPSPPPAPPVEVPQAPVPDVRAPSVPAPQAPSLPGTPASGGSGDAAVGGDSAGGSTAAGSGAAGEATGSTDAAGGGASRDGKAGGAASAGEPANPPVSSRGERSLRREVRELSGCFAALPPFQRRVLDLRTGFSGAPPRSRMRVARGLDVSLRRVRRAESRGLSGLRSSDRATGCGGGSGLGTVWNGVMASVVSAPQLSPLASFDAGGGPGELAGGSSAAGTRGAVRGDRESSIADALPAAPDEPGAASAGEGDQTTAASIEGGEAPLLLWLLAGLAALAVVTLGPALRRHHGRPASADAGAAGGDLAPTGAGEGAKARGVAAVVAAPRGWSNPSATEPRDARAHAAAPESAPAAAAGVREPARPWGKAAAEGETTGPARPPAHAQRPVLPTRRAANPAQRALGIAVSSAVSVAVGLAVRARRRPGRRG